MDPKLLFVSSLKEDVCPINTCHKYLKKIQFYFSRFLNVAIIAILILAIIIVYILFMLLYLTFYNPQVVLSEKNT